MGERQVGSQDERSFCTCGGWAGANGGSIPGYEYCKGFLSSLIHQACPEPLKGTRAGCFFVGSQLKMDPEDCPCVGKGTESSLL